VSDTWTEQFGFGGDKRREASTFKINDKVYLCTGINNGLYLSDFWVFDINNETWSSLKDLDHDDYDDENIDLLRASAVGFSIGNRGFIACGEKYGPKKTVWEYIPESQMWVKKFSFERY